MPGDSPPTSPMIMARPSCCRQGAPDRAVFLCGWRPRSGLCRTTQRNGGSKGCSSGTGGERQPPSHRVEAQNGDWGSVGSANHFSDLANVSCALNSAAMGIAHGSSHQLAPRPENSAPNLTFALKL